MNRVYTSIENNNNKNKMILFVPALYLSMVLFPNIVQGGSRGFKHTHTLRDPHLTSPRLPTWCQSYLSHERFLSHEDCVKTLCGAKSTWADSDPPSDHKNTPFKITSLVKNLSRKRRGIPRLQDLEMGLDMDLSVPGDVFTGVQEMKSILGQGSQVLLDASGTVIGVAAPTPKDAASGKPGGNRDKAEQGQRPSTDDGAICCSTQEVFYINSTMVDYFGNTKTIAQMNQVGVYQFVRHGLCLDLGACPGSCEQIHVTVPLVIHPTGPGQTISYSFFKVPGYCTCRIRSSLRASGLSVRVVDSADESIQKHILHLPKELPRPPYKHPRWSDFKYWK